MNLLAVQMLQVFKRLPYLLQSLFLPFLILFMKCLVITPCIYKDNHIAGITFTLVEKKMELAVIKKQIF